jgi:glycosyltransferase involved in cell wall biosynthesis
VLLYIKYGFLIIKNYISTKKLYYVVEDADWAIMHVGKMITSMLKHVITSRITITHYGIRNSIIHYGSISTFLGQDKIKLPHKSNKIIVTWFHIVPNDERLKLISEAIKYVDIWHTSCQSTQNKMIAIGIPKDKIVVIPLGVDLGYFSNPTKHDKATLKNKFQIPKNKIVIGSFQKDGNGWGEGLEPKLIKGPDIFCNVVEKLAKKYDIFVLLTGPARGYVKNRLFKAGIPYRHDFLENSNNVSNYFKSSDLYMVTSREEGGPISILESMACGVPIISTKVGMAPDIITNAENGFLVDIEDSDAIYRNACEIIEHEELQGVLTQNGLKTISDYNWSNIASQYYKKLYHENTYII